MRRAATADLPQRLLAALAGAARPLTARELGATVGVRQDAAQRALMRALRDGVVVSSYGQGATGRTPLAFSLAPATSDAPEPARAQPRRRPPAQERPCMCCGAPFLSAGAHNRLCSSCRGQSAGAGPFDTPHFVRYR